MFMIDVVSLSIPCMPLPPLHPMHLSTTQLNIPVYNHYSGLIPLIIYCGLIIILPLY